MNIESTSTATATKTTDASTSSANTATKDDSTSFKDQLAAAKTQSSETVLTAGISTTSDAKTTQNKSIETAKTTEETKIAEATQAQKASDPQQTKTQDAAKNNITQQIANDKTTKDKDTTKKEATDPIAELSSKIAALTGLKSGVSKIQTSGLKTKETTDKADIGQTIKLDNKDVSFFLNLVQNQQMEAQAGQGSASNNASTTFTDIKSEVAQKSVQVSSTLLDAMNESSKTGKSFRIDFDSNIAVIMKVDKNGAISANFIPGDTAVENYLRNNIAGLRQNFSDQGLAYNELTYSKQQRQDKQEQQENKKNNKENENE